MRIGRAVVDSIERHGVIDGDRFHVLDGDVFGTHRRTGQVLALDDVVLLSPIVPGKILAALGGFVDLGGSPWLTAKVVTSVSGDHGVIEYPDFIEALAMEAELAVVIGRTVHRGSASDAAEAIFGFTCFNDATAPEFLDERNPRPFPDVYGAKSIDTFASMGPWIRTDLDDDAIARGLEIVCRVNGTTVQQGNTRDYVYAPSDVVRHASRTTTLFAGDVIALGTPYPFPLVEVGDHVEIEIEGIGTLTNHIVRATR